MTSISGSRVLRAELEDTCREAFCISLLLTGSVTLAESAVIDAIESWSPNDTAEGTLMRNVIDKSIASSGQTEIGPFPQIVRNELRPVLSLPDRHRHCFVLRILVNLSRRACARILGLTGLEVDSYTTTALADLAQPAGNHANEGLGIGEPPPGSSSLVGASLGL